MSQYNVKLKKGKIHIHTQIYINSDLNYFWNAEIDTGKYLLKSHRNIKWLSFVARLQVSLFSLLRFLGFSKFSHSCVYYSLYNHVRKSFLCCFFKYVLDAVLALLPFLPPSSTCSTINTQQATCSPLALGKASRWQFQEMHKVDSHKTFARTCPSGTG